MRAVPISVPISEATSELTAPDVAFEACDAFDAEEAEPGICAACGWLDDEHSTADVPAAA